MTEKESNFLTPLRFLQLFRAFNKWRENVAASKIAQVSTNKADVYILNLLDE